VVSCGAWVEENLVEEQLESCLVNWTNVESMSQPEYDTTKSFNIKILPKQSCIFKW